MMYADKQLDNEKWEEYSSVYERAGLKPLAVTVTKILMEYILMKGNFGHKKISMKSVW